MNYEQLQRSLAAMVESGKVSAPVHEAVVGILAALESRPYPAPAMSRTRSGRVVLYWRKRNSRLFLTVGKNSMGGAEYSPNDTRWRLDWNTPDLAMKFRTFIYAETRDGWQPFI